MSNFRQILSILYFLIAIQSCFAQSKIANCDVKILSSLNSAKSRIGQTVEVKLLSSTKVNNINLEKNSIFYGRITKIDLPKRFIHSEVSAKSFMRPGARIYLEFDKVKSGNKTYFVEAKPTPKYQILKSQSYNLYVDKDTSIMCSIPSDVRSKVGRTSVQVLSWVAAPVAPIVGAAVGAMKPDVMLPSASDSKSKKHRRLKGMAAGAIAGIPGGFLINDSVLKGRQTVVASGTHLEITITSLKK